MMLANKKILLIAPKYFGYENEIKYELESQGAVVYLIYENLDKVNLYYKFIYSKFKNQMMNSATKYFINQVNKITTDINYVLIIRGQFVSNETMVYLKNRYSKKCIYLMYQWDSVNNNNNSVKISSFFHDVFTFDYFDAKNYKWKYLPLFYVPAKIKMKKNRNNDFLFMCSLHSDRAQILSELKNYCVKNNYTYKTYMYEKKYIYLKRKYFDKKQEYVMVNNEDVTFSPVSLDEAYELYADSKIVVDFTHPGQKGLTMRSIECLGNECKLITNNNEIIKADFYDKDNIYVYDKDLKIPGNFINIPYHKVDKDIYYSYSIEHWINTLLDISGEI